MYAKDHQPLGHDADLQTAAQKPRRAERDGALGIVT
jgi:hypothetical protein